MNRKIAEILFIPIKLFFIFSITFFVWILLTLSFDFTTILTGVIYSVIITVISYPFFYKNDVLIKYNFLFRIDLIILFFVILLIDSYLSTFQIIIQMFTGNYKSGIMRIKTNLKSKVSKVILANTISLVPGTMSLWIDGRLIYIHWFDIKSTHTTEAGRMIKLKAEKILQELFG